MTIKELEKKFNEFKAETDSKIEALESKVSELEAKSSDTKSTIDFARSKVKLTQK